MPTPASRRGTPPAGGRGTPRRATAWWRTSYAATSPRGTRSPRTTRGGRLHFEEVKCPLRGEKWLCPYEGKICKPRGMASLSGTEWAVAQLYASGYSAREIGEQLGKSLSTVKSQLASCKRKLGLGNCREIVKFLRLRNL